MKTPYLLPLEPALHAYHPILCSSNWRSSREHCSHTEWRIWRRPDALLCRYEDAAALQISQRLTGIRGYDG